MLQYQTLEPFTLGLLRDLSSKEYLKPFVLVWGTALALQLGHRKSIDLDFFTVSDFQSDELLTNLTTDFNIQVLNQTKQALITTIEEIKVDFIRFKYPFQHPIIAANEFKMASIEDIAAMKIDTISGRGNKKDFFDLYFLLQKFSLEQLFTFYTQKYPHQTTFHVLRSLTYFEDAAFQPDPIVFDKSVTWEKVKRDIEKEIKAI